MTAIEWLQSGLELIMSHEEQMQAIGLFEQAKEMEKEQIMNAWDDGQSDGATICTQKADNPSEEYYNKTFKSE